MSKITGSGAGSIPVQRSGVDKGIRERFEGTRSQVVDTRRGVGQTPVDAVARTSARPDSDTSVRTIGSRLAAARRDASVTQIKIAHEISSTQPSIARLERDSSQPNLRTIQRYADAIKTRVVADFEKDGHSVTGVPLDDIVVAISDLRKENQLTQTEVAARMGATQPIIARLEKGDSQPNLKTIERYANAVGYEIGLRVERTG
jgi:transcriptional regulator with XRE-family HTH domain